MSQTLITSIIVLINECAKDFEGLKKLADDIDTNINGNTQLHEMRISILMLKVHLLKTISTWKQKLGNLADLKKKEEKTAINALSRHPSGNNISSLPQPATLQQPQFAPDLASQALLESSKTDAIFPAEISPKISFVSNKNEEDSETKQMLKKDLQLSNETIERNSIDIVNSVSSSIPDGHKALEAQRSLSSTIQPSSIQSTVHVSKPKWHSRDKDVSTSDFQITSPFPTTLHADLYLKPGVLVDESQPSSIIAYTLASSK